MLLYTDTDTMSTKSKNSSPSKIYFIFVQFPLFQLIYFCMIGEMLTTYFNTVLCSKIFQESRKHKIHVPFTKLIHCMSWIFKDIFCVGFIQCCRNLSLSYKYCMENVSIEKWWEHECFSCHLVAPLFSTQRVFFHAKCF